jgi:hypothetical protein
LFSYRWRFIDAVYYYFVYQIGCKILGEINDTFHDSLELTFKTPKIKNNYKGSEVRAFAPHGFPPTNTTTAATLKGSGDEKNGSKAAGSVSTRMSVPEPPAIVKGWLRKEGQSFKSWKKRYFVLNLGEIVYYEKPSSNPPFGEKSKGKLALAGAFIDR